MKFKGIALDDKPIFDNYYSVYPQYSSYLSFVTLFTWRKFIKCEYTLFEDEIIVKFFNGYIKKDCFYLPQLTKDGLKKVIDKLRSENYEIIIYNMLKEQTELLKELYPDEFEIKHNRDGDNYYYLTEKLLTLSGKKLHSKRNHINRFKKQYNYEYINLDASMALECIEVAKDWCERKNCETDKSIMRELSACEEALTNFDALKLKGGAIKIDNRIIAFSVGELLNSETAVIHFEKADTDYTGSFPIINNEFVKNAWADTKYINREEDMGVEGLRKSKLSYYPEFLLETYIVNENNKS